MQFIRNILFWVWVAVPVFATDGYYIEMRVSTYTAQNTQTNESIVKQWFTPDKMLLEQSKQQQILIHIDKQTAYIIDHNKKEYTPLPLEHMQQFNLFSNANQALTKDIKIKKTGKSKKIRDWNCFEISIQSEKFNGNAWLTEEIDPDQSMLKNISRHFSTLSFLTGMMQKNKPVKGFPVEVSTNINMMGSDLTTVMQLSEFSITNIEDKLLELPENYKKLKNPFKQ